MAVTKRPIWTSALGLGVLLFVLATAWIISLPPAPVAVAAVAIPEQETRETIAALRPPKRRRPIVAIVGINDATETTDYLMPLGILRRADVADVVSLSTEPGIVDLYPALRLVPDGTIAQFDDRYPEGADYVIVPAMSRDDDPDAVAWIRRQAERGAIVIGICAGAKVVAAAGLLDGRRATTHWYYLPQLLRKHPTVVHVPDRRFVVDRGVATTTGITASMPMMLTLIEAISGRERAAAVASQLGIESWDARHTSQAFQFTRPFALTAITNSLSFWNHRRLGLELTPGVDEVTLGLTADAWSRTYRSRVISFAATQDPIRSRNGLWLVPETVRPNWEPDRVLTLASLRPAEALDWVLAEIADRFGRSTASGVAMQLEYRKNLSAP